MDFRYVCILQCSTKEVLRLGAKLEKPLQLRSAVFGYTGQPHLWQLNNRPISQGFVCAIDETTTAWTRSRVLAPNCDPRQRKWHLYRAGTKYDTTVRARMKIFVCTACAIVFPVRAHRTSQFELFRTVWFENNNDSRDRFAFRNRTRATVT